MRFALSVVTVLAVSPLAVRADIIEGINFPLGAASFADRVVLFAPGPGIAPPHDNPLDALGVPNFNPAMGGINDVALGNGGTLILEFVDNLLVDQNDVENGLDLFIFERGGAVEPFSLSISNDLVNWIELGTIRGQPTGVDIRPFVNPGDTFRFVRLIDANAQLSGFPFAGADIDAVGAIGSVAVAIPEPSSFMLLGVSALTLALYRSRRTCAGSMEPTSRCSRPGPHHGFSR